MNAQVLGDRSSSSPSARSLRVGPAFAKGLLLRFHQRLDAWGEVMSSDQGRVVHIEIGLAKMTLVRACQSSGKC